LHKFGIPPANDGGKGNKNNHHDETKNTSVSVVNGDISVQASNSYEVKDTSNITTVTASNLSYELQKNSTGRELIIKEIAKGCIRIAIFGFVKTALIEEIDLMS